CFKMATADSKNSKSSKKPGLSQEQIVSGFNELRQQQRAYASKLSELEMERKEHDLVIESLKEVDEDRKCFRMVGGVLVERTVKEVLPALVANSEQIGKLIESFKSQLESKGKEINEYRETHNIKVRGEDGKTPEAAKDTKSSTQGVLVAQNA
ncbi:unnamed protein product, partial [Owenia fusiformis]